MYFLIATIIIFLVTIFPFVTGIIFILFDKRVYNRVFPMSILMLLVSILFTFERGLYSMGIAKVETLTFLSSEQKTIVQDFQSAIDLSTLSLVHYSLYLILIVTVAFRALDITMMPFRILAFVLLGLALITATVDITSFGMPVSYTDLAIGYITYHAYTIYRNVGKRNRGKMMF